MATQRRRQTVAPLAPMANLVGTGVPNDTLLQDIIEVCLAAPMDGYPGDPNCLWGLPLLVEGLPGLAKSARIKQMARTLQVTAKSLFGAQHPPEDFSGVIVPDGHGGANQLCPLAQVRQLVATGEGVIFLDEITGAPPATQGAIQSFIHERIVGDCEIPGRIRIVSAANPESIATGGFRLAPALANRFVHVSDPGPPVREFIKFHMRRIDASTEEPHASLLDLEDAVVKGWPDVFAETLGLFGSFLERVPANLHKCPPISDPQSGKAWPSHRTWDYAMRAWTTSKILGKAESTREALVEACVGAGASNEFLEYARNTDIPKPVDVLSGKWKIDPNRLDIVLAAYTSTMTYVAQRPTREEKLAVAADMWSAISRLIDAKLSDIAIPCVEGMVAERLGINAEVPSVAQAAKTALIPISKSGIGKFMTQKT